MTYNVQLVFPGKTDAKKILQHTLVLDKHTPEKQEELQSLFLVTSGSLTTEFK